MLEFVKTEPGDDPIIVECFFAAPPSDVFQAWVDPEIIMQWFGPYPNSLISADIDLRIGGKWRFVKSRNEETVTGFEGEYLIIEPETTLAFTWAQFAENADGTREVSPHSKVEIEFSPKGAGTDLRLSHSGMPNEEARKGFAGGWERGFANLHALLGEAKT